MALVIEGKTRCGLCGDVLLRGDAVISFPPLAMNEADPLHMFSDNAFHQRCFVAEPRGGDAQRRSDELRARTAPGRRQCAFSGEEIRSPDDYVSFGFIADEPPAVAALNYLQFHRVHLARWPGLRAAHQALLALESSPAWQGQALRRLLVATAPFAWKTLLQDAEVRPDLFVWNGPVTPAAMDLWMRRCPLLTRCPEELLAFWRMTGGGDLFERETIFGPSSNPEVGDDLVAALTRQRRGCGFGPVRRCARRCAR